MRTQTYPSDLADAQWALIEPHLPVYPGGRPRKTDLRDVVDAVFYLLRTGCQWRYLPKDFPPKSTVWRYFDESRHNGTLDTIHDLLRKTVRTAEKPYSPRTTASVDSQSVDTTGGGEQRGRDNAKNVDGRKRHIVVDSMGLLLAVLVTAADVDDAKAAAAVFARLEGQPMSRVERTFAWLGTCRRLSKDRERSVLSSETFIKLAMIHLMLNRLEPKETDAEFHYSYCPTSVEGLSQT